MSYLKSIGTAIIYIGFFLALITFIPGLPPDTEFREYSIAQPRDIDPKLGSENRLDNAEKLFQGRFVGPEAFAAYDGKIYTGVYDGYLLRLDEDDFVPIIKFGEKCDSWQEQKCGRMLGLKFDKKGNLYVVDTYYGIFKVNVATGEYKNIVNISTPIEGKFSLCPNNIDVAENGDLYWSDSSTDFALYDLVHILLSNPSGRLIRYNASKKKNEVLLKNLAFANGVILSDDESFVLVSESMACRIIKYHLKGPKAGQHEIFIDGLPGLPDNLQSDGQGGFLVTTIITLDSQHPAFIISLIPHPYLRKMIVRLLLVMELPFKLLYDIYPNTFAEKVLHTIGSYHMTAMFDTTLKKSLLLRIDASGNIIEILSSNDNTLQSISEAYIHNGYVWFGSPWKNYVGRVPLKQAFPDLVNNEKQFSRTKSENVVSNVKSEKAKQNTISTSTPIISKQTSTSTTTSKPTTAPTITAPKPSPTPKVDKSTTIDNSNAKSTSKSANAEVKKKSAETTSDAKFKTKSTLSDAKSETNNKKEDIAKKDIKSEKSVKVEQEASIKKEKSPEKIKSIKTNRPRDDL